MTPVTALPIRSGAAGLARLVANKVQSGSFAGAVTITAPFPFSAGRGLEVPGVQYPDAATAWAM